MLKRWDGTWELTFPWGSLVSLSLTELSFWASGFSLEKLLPLGLFSGLLHMHTNKHDCVYICFYWGCEFGISTEPKCLKQWTLPLILKSRVVFWKACHLLSWFIQSGEQRVHPHKGLHYQMQISISQSIHRKKRITHPSKEVGTHVCKVGSPQ